MTSTRAVDVVTEVLEVASRRAPKDAVGHPVLVIRGVVRAGVEHRSVVLHATDGRRFQLGAGYGRLRGRRVLVEGRPKPKALTTSQEGIPLEVLRVDDLSD